MKYLKHGLIRGTVPFLLLGLLAIAMQSFGADAYSVRAVLFTGMVVGVALATSVVYELPKMGQLSQLLLHLVLLVMTVIPLIFVGGMLKTDTMEGLLQAFGFYLLVWAILWAGFLAAYVFKFRLLKQSEQ